MISASIHLRDVDVAEPVQQDGQTWVALRYAGGGRLIILTHNFGQAVAIADAINSEQEARREAVNAA